MKFEIKFDEEIYRKQIQLLYNLAYDKEIRYNKHSNYLGYFLFFIGILVMCQRQYFFGLVLLMFSLWNLIPYYIKFFKQYFLLKRLNEEKKGIISIYSENPITKWELSESTFKFSDFNGENFLKWTDFKAYTVINETIFMFTKTDNPYILDKSEIGNENFESIVELIKEKIKTSY